MAGAARVTQKLAAADSNGQASTQAPAQNPALRLLLLLTVPLVLQCARHVAHAALAPTCVNANTDCTVPAGTYSLTATTIYEHSTNLTIDAGATFECTADYCEVGFDVAWTLTVLGTIEAPKVSMFAHKVVVDGATLDTAARGRAPGTGTGRGVAAAGSPGSGAGYGGWGADSCGGQNPVGGSGYGESTTPVGFMGSGGADGLSVLNLVTYSGGRGGGVIEIDAQHVQVGRGAVLSAKGGDGDKHPLGNEGLAGGGGSGGSVLITAREVFGFFVGGGQIDVRGGAGSTGYPDGDSGAGGGGRVYILAGSSVPVNIDVLFDGGDGGCGGSNGGSYLRQQFWKQCVIWGAMPDFDDPGAACWCIGNFDGEDCDYCNPGFYGDDCSGQCPDCGIHGSCSDNVTGTGCVCTGDWDGERCDECVEDKYGEDCDQDCPFCGGHAHCDDGRYGSGDCVCDLGWAGALCDECAPGYYGTQCELQCPACAHGTCDDGQGNSGVCLCHTGWDGTTCNVCDASYYGPLCQFQCPACGVNAACDDGRDGIGCKCNDGWVRPTPEDDCTDCLTGVFGAACDGACPSCAAAGGGTCDDGTGGSGLCVCDPGRFGALCDGTCPDCGDHGSCSEGRSGTGLCVCDSGWTGAACDECEAGVFGVACQFDCPDCGPNADCDVGTTGRGCMCDAGWVRPTPLANCTACLPQVFGPLCADDCPDCGAHGDCNDGVQGDGTCECHPGFLGVNCTSACPDCGDHGSCDDGRLGSGECVCDDGWGGDACDTCLPGRYGLSCQFECGDCGTHAECEDGFQGEGCKCDDRWRQADNDGCDGGGGGNTTTSCTECEPGFYGGNCDPCDECGGNGSCDDGYFGSGVCTCNEGWTGLNCDECVSGRYGPSCTGVCPACAALSGARACDDGVAGTGACLCTGGWVGATCELCSSFWGGQHCNECAPGHWGPSCQMCQCDVLHGSCDDGLDGTGECSCDAGFDQDAACRECVDGRFGPDCALCPSCGLFGACDDGLHGSGACVCLNSFEGGDCAMSSVSEYCAWASPDAAANDDLPPLVAGTGLCLPGVAALERGIDLVRGERSLGRTLAVGFRSPVATFEYGGTDWAIPSGVSASLDGDGTGSIAADAASLVRAGVTVAGTAADVVDYMLTRRLGIVVDDSSVSGPGSESGSGSGGVGAGSVSSTATPAGALAGSDGVVSAVEALRRHKALAGTVGTVSAYSIANNALTPTVSFVKAALALPQWPLVSSGLTSSEMAARKAQYRAFLQAHGTHFTTAVRMGGAVELSASIGLCASSLGDLTADEEAMSAVYAALNVTASAAVPSLAAPGPRNDVPGAFAGLSTARRVVGGVVSALTVAGYVPSAPVGGASDAGDDGDGDNDPSSTGDEALSMWAGTVLGNPGIVGVTVAPIDALLDGVEVGSSGWTEASLRAAVRAAVADYFAEAAAALAGPDGSSAAVTRDESDASLCMSRAVYGDCGSAGGGAGAGTGGAANSERDGLGSLFNSRAPAGPTVHTAATAVAAACSVVVALVALG